MTATMPGTLVRFTEAVELTAAAECVILFPTQRSELKEKCGALTPKPPANGKGGGKNKKIDQRWSRTRRKERVRGPLLAEEKGMKELIERLERERDLTNAVCLLLDGVVSDFLFEKGARRSGRALRPQSLIRGRSNRRTTAKTTTFIAHLQALRRYADEGTDSLPAAKTDTALGFRNFQGGGYRLYRRAHGHRPAPPW